ncbi:hypothetical protein N1851_002222 [Merluccius polli]|uniref:DDE Tnp4 domain-containing protein n=1 Tax=Merluccius polli TaxID=89951 RepID=A0AA47PB66_MERPO|nr:hypothetical protein N1851_002222 [Merluccius polli]
MAVYFSRRRKVEDGFIVEPVTVCINMMKSRLIIDFNYYKAAGDLGPYSQRILALKFIRFPLDNQQLHRIKANFMACRYAGVVGAVDGTHIQIIAPSKDEDVFVNRNERSTHDPHILMGSGLRQLFERHLVPVGCLAG